MIKFYSIETVDEEGELIVRHAFMTDEQREVLNAEFVARGRFVQIHDLTPPQIVESPAVLSCDEE